jgi:hypothetical protein
MDVPLIGKYITHMLEGSLDERKVAQKACERSDGATSMAISLPSRDMRDIKGYPNSNNECEYT